MHPQNFSLRRSKPHQVQRDSLNSFQNTPKAFTKVHIIENLFWSVYYPFFHIALFKLFLVFSVFLMMITLC